MCSGRVDTLREPQAGHRMHRPISGTGVEPGNGSLSAKARSASDCGSSQIARSFTSRLAAPCWLGASHGCRAQIRVASTLAGTRDDLLLPASSRARLVWNRFLAARRDILHITGVKTPWSLDPPNSVELDLAHPVRAGRWRRSVLGETGLEEGEGCRSRHLALPNFL
jgi:hypothetical protein